MSKASERDGVIDTITLIKKLLKSIEDSEVAEAHIESELQQIRQEFWPDEGFPRDSSEGFYGDMIRESHERAKKLLWYRLRLESVHERLKVF